MRPFVYRKYLDYATLAAMRRLHAEVRRDVARRELAGHVKLGPGGIREIEFIAQALQLVRGGRDPSSRRGRRWKCCRNSAKKNLLPEARPTSSSAAYVFLRNVEHRLQYLDDAQTPRTARGRGGPARVSRRWPASVPGSRSPRR